MSYDITPHELHYQAADRDDRLSSQLDPVAALNELARQLEQDAGVPSTSTDEIRVAYSRAKLRKMAAICAAAAAIFLAACAPIQPRTTSTEPELVARFNASRQVCHKASMRVCARSSGSSQGASCEGSTCN